MLNQVAVEALYSATYLEDYLDGVENLPNDLQRLLSRMREFDVDFQAIIRDLETLKDKLLSEETNEAESSDAVMLAGGGPSNSNPASSRAGHWRKRILQEVQKALISSLEIGDEKLQLVQAIQDVVENKARQLETDSKNLEFGREQEVAETTPKDTQTTVRETSNGNNNKETTAASGSGSASDGRQSKRPRRSRNEAVIGIATASTSYQELDLPVPAVTPVSTTTMQQRKISSASNSGSSISGKKKKRRSVRGIVEREKEKEKEKEKERSNSPPEIPIDPDEPTYCLCDQVSYGEMIGCDNDLCPIEWFHFSCVQLLTKPKGKWFCPRCRGDRPTVMKPKAQFLKELERYNKEKEEKA